MRKPNGKRISFNAYNAEHLYEYLLFYWAEHKLRHPKDQEQMDRFGNCPECRMIGKRLEAFLGSKTVQFQKRLVNKFIKQYATTATRRKH